MKVFPIESGLYEKGNVASFDFAIKSIRRLTLYHTALIRLRGRLLACP
jgi:hypothetical protein